MKRYFRSNLIRVVAAMFLFAILLPLNAHATEFGGGAYPNGAEDSMSGAVPPPGFYYLNYDTYYTSNSLKDRNGDRLDIPFKVHAFANVSRFIYTSPVKVLGGDLGGHLLVPVVYLDVTDPRGHQSRTGLGDLDIAPFVAWHWSNFHAVTAFEVIMPTGGFDKNRIANIGRNYWTFEPVVAVTYISAKGIEISGKFMYDINTENSDTDYKSGQEFHFDYFGGYHLGAWTLGVNGYYYKQITNDKINGQKAEPDGNKGRVFAIGPMVKFDMSKRVFFIAKYQRETYVENRPEGDKFWLKVFYAF